MKFLHTSCFFILLSVVPAQAQSSFGPFISNAYKHPSVTSFDKQLVYISNKPYSPAPFQKIELRTESNQLDPTRQDYAIRLNPANPWEMRLQNQYFKELSNSLQLKKNLALKAELSSRYKLLVNLVVAKQFMELAKKKLYLVRRYTSTLEKQQHSTSFDAEDYLELTLEEMEEEVHLEEMAFEFEQIKLQVSTALPEPSAFINEWALEEIITPEQIKAITDSATFRINSTTGLYYKSKIGLAKREYEIEKANINIGYVQTQYQHFRIEQGRRPWSIGLGVALPLVNPNKSDMTKRRLDIIESEQELSEVELDVTEEQQKSLRELKSLLNRYQSIQEKLTTLNVSQLSSTISVVKDSNPVAGLRFQYNLYKLELLKVKLHQRILFVYIEWLTNTDALQQVPLTNYLSKNLETLSSE